MTILLLGVVILIGTSSPILGRLFVDNPTPPDVSFYNEWSMPIAMIMAILTVIGQYLFWKRHDAESLASALIWPMVITSAVTMFTIFWAQIQNLYYILYIFCAYFAVVGNGAMLLSMIRKNPKLTGGAVTHLGFALLLLGIIASSAYNEPMLDQQIRNYNRAIENGEVTDEQGFPVTQKVNMLELKVDQPKIINDRYKVTYEGYSIDNTARPGEQNYRIKFEDLERSRWFYLNPDVYPMMATSRGGNIEWAVDPAVRTGLFEDIYLYVAGSSYVEHYEEAHANQGDNSVQPVSMNQSGGVAADTADAGTSLITLEKGEEKEAGSYRIRFNDFNRFANEEVPYDSVVVAVRADVSITRKGESGSGVTVSPLFALVKDNGKNVTYSPGEAVDEMGLNLQFREVNPNTGEITLAVRGLDGEVQENWVLIVAESKPFISVVWLGTFLLMGGFSISIFRRWKEDKERVKPKSEVA